MSERESARSRRPSRSAALVAACRMLAAELDESERLIDDPFAHLVADDAAIAAARADEPLQNVIRLRTRYSRRFDEPLVASGFEPSRPTIVVWEGVINYLDAHTAESTVEQIAAVLGPGGQLVADYVEMSWFKGAAFERATASISRTLRDGGEPLRGGLADVRGTLARHGLDIVDDVATEDLRPRYGLSPLERHYPTRMLTATRSASPPEA